MTRTKLEHSDFILRAETGDWLLACEPVEGTNMGAGGVLEYQVGARFRVTFACPGGGLIWCLDEDARDVTFRRGNMHALEMKHHKATTK